MSVYVFPRYIFVNMQYFFPLGVNPDDATGAALEAALVDVADCKSFQGKSDKWELQKWAWNEYDPAFFHLSLRQHQNASEYRPNGLDSKDRNITPMPYAPFPPSAHKSFIRLRRDITADACVVAILYRSLHVHCSEDIEDKFLANLEHSERKAYSPEALSETILGRVIHLLTLGAYAWEDITTNDNWRNSGGGDLGSVFHEFQEVPVQKDWVEKVLLAKPSVIMSSDIYAFEHSALQLLHKLVTTGGSKNFKVQDRSIRCGAAWLCEYAIRHNKNAAALLGDDATSTDSKVMLDTLEADKKRRSKEAQERAMKKFSEKMARFAESIDLSSDSDHPHVDNGIKAALPDLPPPQSPTNAEQVTGSNEESNGETPKTSETQMMFSDNVSGEAPKIPTLMKLSDGNETVVEAIPRLFKERPSCIICADDGITSQNIESSTEDLAASGKPKKKILTLCGYIQPSTVARGCGGTFPAIDADNEQNLVGMHVSLCGHAIHVTCCESHLKDSGQDRYVDGKRADFRCPMCRGLSNCLVPFLDVGHGWAFNQVTTGFENARTKLLHDFLDRSKWWAARNDSLFIWNGRCSFVPREASADCVDPKIKFFGKKDLCRAWSTVLWTPPYERGVVQSNTSTGVTVVWRRVLDQNADISHKADIKRIGESNVHLGEFRHYLIEKQAYNQQKQASGTYDPLDVS